MVLTVDEALYCKLQELKWAKQMNFLILRHGGLHITLNFLKAIGKHVQSSGLLEAWIESNILGPRAAEQVLAGNVLCKGNESAQTDYASHVEDSPATIPCLC